MELIPVMVECHSGYKADEYPKNFRWDNVEFEIIEIIDRWYESYNKSTSNAVNYFKVKTNLLGSLLLKHEVVNDRWFLVV
jgi:hypothetical protein